MNVYEQNKLALRLLNLHVGQSSGVVSNGAWKFTVHRYADCWYCLWDSSVYEMRQGRMGRDIGRVFVEPDDLIKFAFGYPMPRFVLEAQEIGV